MLAQSERKLASARPVEGKLDLNGWGLRSLDGLLPTTRVESLFARSNNFRTLHGMPAMPKLQLLDLSANALLNLQGLGKAPLRMLYLAANNISDITVIPTFPNLEVLTLSHNKISSLDGMNQQPQLKVLSLSANRLQSLRGLPVFPQLETLRLADNPLCATSGYEVAAACACGPTLLQIDGNTAPETAQQQPVRVGVAVRAGLVLTSIDRADVDAEQFLVDAAKATVEPCKLKGGLEGEPQENCELVAAVQLTYDDQQLYEPGQYHGPESVGFVKFQWQRAKHGGIITPIPDAVTRSYVPTIEDVGHALICQVSPTLPDGTEVPPAMLVTANVQASPPAITSLVLSGNSVEGSKLIIVADYVGGIEGASSIRWLLRRDEQEPELLMEGNEHRSVVLDLAHIGASVLVEYCPVRDDGAIGNTVTFESDIVQAARPQITQTQIKGTPVEGELLHGTGKYFGGSEGASMFQWYRGESAGGPFVPIAGATLSTYTPSQADIRYVLRFEYTPVSTRGVVGQPAFHVCTPVLPAPPVIKRLQIIGATEEFVEMYADADYFGGIQGSSEIIWSRTGASTGDRWVDIEGANTPSYVPTGDDISCFLRVRYLPVRDDGARGKEVSASTTTPVRACSPRADGITIDGALRESQVLRAVITYRGGRQGASVALWERQIEGQWEEIANTLTYTPSASDAGSKLRFTFTPVRDDGVAGPSVTVNTDVVQPAPPQICHLELVGPLEQGATLEVSREYIGGKEGASTFRWLRFRDSDDGAVTEEVKLASADSYTLGADDVDCILALEYIPVREDGVVGPGALVRTSDRIKPGDPELRNPRLTGTPAEGAIQSVVYEYYGGVEGPTAVVWHRRPFADASAPWAPAGNGRTYTPCNLDVNCILRATITPIRSDGAKGATVALSTTEGVEAGLPQVKNLGVPPIAEENVEIIPDGSYFGAEPGPQSYKWYRIVPGGSESVVCTERNYTPLHDDIGCQLRLEWTPQRSDGVVGAVQVVTTPPVIPGVPVAQEVRLQQLENADFVVTVVYRGGEEGKSLFEWQRIDSTGIPKAVEGVSGKVYTPVYTDTGCAIRVLYTPVRADGVKGNQAKSDASPRLNFKDIRSIDNVSVSGTLVEGETLTATATGYTQQLVYQWSRKAAGSAAFVPIQGAKRSTYTLELKDNDCVIRAEVTPIYSSLQGRTAFGETATVAAATPELRNAQLSITGGGFQSSTLTFTCTYFGGVEGKSIVRWVRKTEDAGWNEVAGVSGLAYKCSADDIGALLAIEYTPVRADGKAGTMVRCEHAVPIQINPELQRHVESLMKSREPTFDVKLLQNETGKLASPEPRGLLLNKDKLKIRVRGSVKTLYKQSYNPCTRIFINPLNSTHFALDCDPTHLYQFQAATPQDRDVIVLILRKWEAESRNSRDYKKLETAQKGAKARTAAVAIKDLSWLTDADGAAAAGPAR